MAGQEDEYVERIRNATTDEERIAIELEAIQESDNSPTKKDPDDGS